MATAILGLIGLGWYMTPFLEDNPHFSEQLYFWHKSFGVLMFFLILVRVVVRYRSSIPALPGSLQTWEILSARWSHRLLYGLMICVPLAGYVDSSSQPASSGVHFFVVDLPQLIPDNVELSKIANRIHEILAYSLLALVVFHTAGAIKHRFFDTNKRSDVFPRIF